MTQGVGSQHDAKAAQGSDRVRDNRQPIQRQDDVMISEESMSLLGGIEQSRGEEHTQRTEEGSQEAVQEDLTPDEEKQVRELKARDTEVRAHEQAHKAGAGELATGGPTYDYEKGPDGHDYAVGGEVGISLREGDTPEESIHLAQQARDAALAPAEPSGQDRKVAAQAAQMEQQARAEVREEQTTAKSDASNPPATSASPDPMNRSRISAYTEIARSLAA